jgi:hypothetical protein
MMSIAISSSTAASSAPNAGAGSARAQAGTQLTPEQQKTVRELAAIDRKVRAHEAAHLAAAGSIALSAASFGYTRGPDGQSYATSGEVNIDSSPANTPEETLRKAEQIHSAALAPADPSPQDLRVASQAEAMASEARLEILRQQAQSYTASLQAKGGRIDTQA